MRASTPTPSKTTIALLQHVADNYTCVNLFQVPFMVVILNCFQVNLSTSPIPGATLPRKHDVHG